MKNKQVNARDLADGKRDLCKFCYFFVVFIKFTFNFLLLFFFIVCLQPFINVSESLCSYHLNSEVGWNGRLVK